MLDIFFISLCIKLCRTSYVLTNSFNCNPKSIVTLQSLHHQGSIIMTILAYHWWSSAFCTNCSFWVVFRESQDCIVGVYLGVDKATVKESGRATIDILTEGEQFLATGFTANPEIVLCLREFPKLWMYYFKKMFHPELYWSSQEAGLLLDK